MLGRRDAQYSLFAASTYLGEDAVDRMGFYGRLAVEGRRLFRDDDFAGAYRVDFGRPSVPPSLLACARLLQHYEGISDAEVVERCRYDLRWKVALDLDLASIESPFAKSTFQGFRARLTLHAQEGLAFECSVQAARDAGLLPKHLTVALDSSPVRGRGAVKDTFNLLSDAIAAVLRVVARGRDCSVGDLAVEQDLGRHILAPSLKGSEDVDWSDPESVSGFLGGLVEDCDHVVALAESDGVASEEVVLLRKVLAQDVEPDDPGGRPRLRDGVTKGRTISVHDPEMRHGHKSHGRLYSGHKGHLAVETTSGVITAVAVTSPAEPDGGQVRELVEETERTTEREVKVALGDTAYGTRPAQQQAHAAGVQLKTKMSLKRRGGRFAPSDFAVRRDRQQARCPAGHSSAKKKRQRDEIVHEWDPAVCGSCPRRAQCTTASRRTLTVGPDFHDRRSRERWSRSPVGRQLLRQRMVVEHGFGRLKRRGAGVARCFGRAKTKDQWSWTAAVVNLSLIWSREGEKAAA
jgi:transposase